MENVGESGSRRPAQASTLPFERGPNSRSKAQSDPRIIPSRFRVEVHVRRRRNKEVHGDEEDKGRHGSGPNERTPIISNNVRAGRISGASGRQRNKKRTTTLASSSRPKRLSASDTKRTSNAPSRKGEEHHRKAATTALTAPQRWRERRLMRQPRRRASASAPSRREHLRIAGKKARGAGPIPSSIEKNRGPPSFRTPAVSRREMVSTGGDRVRRTSGVGRTRAPTHSQSRYRLGLSGEKSRMATTSGRQQGKQSSDRDFESGADGLQGEAKEGTGGIKERKREQTAKEITSVQVKINTPSPAAPTPLPTLKRQHLQIRTEALQWEFATLALQHSARARARSARRQLCVLRNLLRHFERRTRANRSALAEARRLETLRLCVETMERPLCPSVEEAVRAYGAAETEACRCAAAALQWVPAVGFDKGCEEDLCRQFKDVENQMRMVMGEVETVERQLVKGGKNDIQSHVYDRSLGANARSASEGEEESHKGAPHPFERVSKLSSDMAKLASMHIESRALVSQTEREIRMMRPSVTALMSQLAGAVA